MSNGNTSIAANLGVRISDYETMGGKDISNSLGPVCATCGKPYQRGKYPEIECQCPRHPERAVGDARPDYPGQEQSEALWAIAVALNKIVKHFGMDKQTTDPVPDIQPAMLLIPGVTGPDTVAAGAGPDVIVPGMPTLPDAEKIAANEAKKAETLARLAKTGERK